MAGSCDVVIIGAGLAGLVAARVLCGAGLDVVLLEADEQPGGRVRTDRVDGLLLDRGFQLLNPSYPQAGRTFDLRALRLRSFGAGAVVAHGDRRYPLVDPRRSPRDALSALQLPVGTVREKIAFARWAIEVGFGPAARIKGGTDTSLAEALQRRGLHGAFTDAVVRTFLSGVLGEDELRTSRRLADLLVRSFVRGTPALPEDGMQALPDHLMRLLPDARAAHLRTRHIGVRRARRQRRGTIRRARSGCRDRRTSGRAAARRSRAADAIADDLLSPRRALAGRPSRCCTSTRTGADRS